VFILTAILNDQINILEKLYSPYTRIITQLKTY